MEREIKFRCWNEWADRNEMVYFTLDTAMIFENCTTNAKVMEYTGLKDKNGTGIYEGDIHKDEENMLWEVIFDKGMFILENMEIPGRQFITEDIEYIGNKYENAEMLED